MSQKCQQRTFSFQRAASHAIMLSRRLGAIGSIRKNSARGSPGSRMMMQQGAIVATPPPGWRGNCQRSSRL
jgi:hypothetical protein